MTRFPLDVQVTFRSADGDCRAHVHELVIIDDPRSIELHLTPDDAAGNGTPAVTATLDADIAQTTSPNAASLIRELRRAGPLTDLANWTLTPRNS